MFRRQGLYPIVWKVSLLAYELDILPDSRIHSVVSIAYLTRYRSYEDIFGRIFPSLGLVEVGTDIDISGDDVWDGKHWELECIIDYKIKRGKM